MFCIYIVLVGNDGVLAERWHGEALAEDRVNQLTSGGFELLLMETRYMEREDQ